MKDFTYFMVYRQLYETRVSRIRRYTMNKFTPYHQIRRTHKLRNFITEKKLAYVGNFSEYCKL